MSGTDLILGLTILVIVMLIWNWAPGPWDHMDRMTSTPSLGVNLTKAGWVLYVRNGCPWCTKQLAEFSEEEKKQMKIIECSNNPECQNAGVSAFPTWVNKSSGRHDSGYKPREKVGELLK